MEDGVDQAGDQAAQPASTVEAVGEPVGLTIVELARAVGLGTPALRAWEANYGILRPWVGPNGQRLYGAGDQRRLRAVLGLRAIGLSVPDACAKVLTHQRAAGLLDSEREQTSTSRELAQGSAGALGDQLRGQLHHAVDTYDDLAVRRCLDQLFTEMPLAQAMDEQLMPFLKELGERWERDEVTLAQERFVTTIVHRRVATMIAPATQATGPVIVMATPSGELHFLALLGLAALLSERGTRVRFLGPATPSYAIASAGATADLVVLSAIKEERFLSPAPIFAELGKRVPVVIGGPGATDRAVEACRAVRAPRDLSEAADHILLLAQAVTEPREPH